MLKHPAIIALIMCTLAWAIVVAVALTNRGDEASAPSKAPTISYTDCWPDFTPTEPTR